VTHRATAKFWRFTINFSLTSSAFADKTFELVRATLLTSRCISRRSGAIGPGGSESTIVLLESPKMTRSSGSGLGGTMNTNG
jgi:hypothetical protein